MARVFITGLTDGIGFEAARQLLTAGHQVVCHARNPERAERLSTRLPGVDDVLVGDLESLEQTTGLAQQAAGSGPFDAVIHNAGIGGGQSPRTTTGDGMERIFHVNTVAPYLLTALMAPSPRLVYLTSGLEAQGGVELDDLQFERRAWDGMQAYSDSKLHDVLLAFAVARLRPQVRSNAVDPGWIKTKLGGPDAWDEPAEGAATQVWLATSTDDPAQVTGRYFKRLQPLAANAQASDVGLQESLLAKLAELTGVALPR